MCSEADFGESSPSTSSQASRRTDLRSAIDGCAEHTLAQGMRVWGLWYLSGGPSPRAGLKGSKRLWGSEEVVAVVVVGEEAA
jgi:hypothetical protein